MQPGEDQLPSSGDWDNGLNLTLNFDAEFGKLELVNQIDYQMYETAGDPKMANTNLMRNANRASE